MKGIIPLRQLVILFLILLLFPLNKPVFAADINPQSIIQLPEAVQNGQVEAWAQPNSNGMGFRKVMLIVHLKNLTNANIQIQIAPGTRYISKNDKYASMIQISPALINLGQQEVTAEVNAFSLNHNGLFPPAMEDTYQYQVGTGINADPAMLKLLDKINSLQEVDSFGAQLAIWSKEENIPIDQLSQQLNTGATAEEIAEARALLGMPPAAQPDQNGTNQTPGSQPSEIASNPNQVSNNPVAANLLGSVLIAAFVLVVLVAGLVTLNDSRKRKAFEGSLGQTGNTGGVLPGVPPVKPVRGTTQDSTPTRILLLKVCKGPFSGKIFTVQTPGLISRGEFTWVVLPDSCVTIPHATIDMLEIPYQIKDLNSENGIWIGDQRLAKKFVDWPLGKTVRLGSDLKLISVESGVLVEEGKTAGSIFHNNGNILVLSREEIHVLVTGKEDKRISDVHALVMFRDKELVIRDLNSTNGTFVNQQRVEIETKIKAGDHVQIGETEFEVQIGS